MAEATKENVLDVEEKVKLELETIYKDRKLSIETLTQILKIPKKDVQNILGV